MKRKVPHLRVASSATAEVGRHTPSVGFTAGSAMGREHVALPASETLEMVIHSKAGTRVHQLIAAGVRGDAADIAGLARQLWQIDPVGGTIRASVRGACLSKANSYLRRFRPGPDWELAGVELELGSARADLVWQHTSTQAVFVDEVKVGAPGIDDPEVGDQVRRLVDGGRARWGLEFRGVRLVQLGAPRRVATWDLVGSRLGVVAGADPEELL